VHGGLGEGFQFGCNKQRTKIFLGKINNAQITAAAEIAQSI
jgi:hypothetical protein